MCGFCFRNCDWRVVACAFRTGAKRNADWFVSRVRRVFREPDVHRKWVFFGNHHFKGGISLQYRTCKQVGEKAGRLAAEKTFLVESINHRQEREHDCVNEINLPPFASHLRTLSSSEADRIRNAKRSRRSI